MSGPPVGLLLALRLREWGGWAMIVVEARWRAMPRPVRAVLRRVARLGPIRGWIRND